MPKEMRHDMEDRFERLVYGKNFDWPPDGFKAQAQADLVEELRRKGYRLKCYDDPRPEEKIAPRDDYFCWFVVRSAYDNVPAKAVTLTFAKGRLANVKVEFPDSSFRKLDDYLSRRLERYPHSDGVSRDIFGKPITVWQVSNALVMTSAEPTEDQPLTVLWSSDGQ